MHTQGLQWHQAQQEPEVITKLQRAGLYTCEHVALSADYTLDEEDATLHPPELLHTLTPGDLPSHSLRLRKGMPIMIIRNLDQLSGTDIRWHLLGCKQMKITITGVCSVRKAHL